MRSVVTVTFSVTFVSSGFHAGPSSHASSSIGGTHGDVQVDATRAFRKIKQRSGQFAALPEAPMLRQVRLLMS